MTRKGMVIVRRETRTAFFERLKERAIESVK